MKEASSDRRVSKIADLDREAVRGLCDLHPFGLGRLCSNVGMERTVLSHFFSGRRLLPQKYAPQFLRQIGLTVKGEVDPRHCFYIAVAPGMEDLATSWIKRLFPAGGERVTLCRYLDGDDGTGEPIAERRDEGWALYGGGIAAVVQDSVHFGDASWIPGVWDDHGLAPYADDLLSVAHLPSKADVIAAVHSIPIHTDLIWSEIQKAASDAGLEGNDVLRILNDAIRVLPEERKKIVDAVPNSPTLLTPAASSSAERIVKRGIFKPSRNRLDKKSES